MSIDDEFGDLLSLRSAQAIIAERLSCNLGVERVSIGACVGRVVSRDIEARYSVPRYMNSAVDGYGFRYGDLHGVGETRLRVIGVARAGHPCMDDLGVGSALRVFTGATFAESGVDTIVMQENCYEDGDDVVIPSIDGIRCGMNLRMAGDDVGIGDLLVSGGERLQAWHVGLLAAQGFAEVEVFERLRVGVLSTGDELCNLGEGLGEGKIYDSNRAMLLHCLAGGGYGVDDCGILADKESLVLDFMRGFRGDVLLVSGGMSTGQEDHVRRILDEHGDLYFWRLGVKPGRPAGLGVLPRESGDLLVIGLPGNPVAAFTIYAFIGKAALARLSGGVYQYPRGYQVRLGEAIGKKVGRQEFLRAYLQSDSDGEGREGWAYRAGKSGAGVLSSIALADGFLDLPAEMGDLQKGDKVSFIPLSSLLSD